MLTAEALLDYFAHYRTAFRAEFRSSYLVASDEDAAGTSDFRRWLDGAPAPDPQRKGSALAALRAELADGRRLCRVKVMSAVPTEYERYACEWGYALNVEVGEEVHIWDLAEMRLPTGVDGLPDFWLIDDVVVLGMRYDQDGRFLGADLSDDAELGRYLAVREALLAQAHDFRSWWAAHPGLRRGGAAA